MRGGPHGSNLSTLIIGPEIGAEEMPGFLVLAVFGVAAVGSEEDFGLSVGGMEGDDEPDGDGNDVSGDEVELVRAIGHAVGVNVTFESVAALALGGLDLNAQEVGPVAAFAGG